MRSGDVGSHGRVSLGEAVRARPYVLAGVGHYGVGTPRPEFGGNAGAGVRLDVPRMTAFIEGRRHGAYARTFLTFGLALRR